MFHVEIRSHILIEDVPCIRLACCDAANSKRTCAKAWQQPYYAYILLSILSTTSAECHCCDSIDSDRDSTTAMRLAYCTVAHFQCCTAMASQ